MPSHTKSPSSPSSRRSKARDTSTGPACRRRPSRYTAQSTITMPPGVFGGQGPRSPLLLRTRSGPALNDSAGRTARGDAARPSSSRPRTRGSAPTAAATATGAGHPATTRRCGDRPGHSDSRPSRHRPATGRAAMTDSRWPVSGNASGRRVPRRRSSGRGRPRRETGTSRWTCLMSAPSGHHQTGTGRWRGRSTRARRVEAEAKDEQFDEDEEDGEDRGRGRGGGRWSGNIALQERSDDRESPRSRVRWFHERSAPSTSCNRRSRRRKDPRPAHITGQATAMHCQFTSSSGPGGGTRFRPDHVNEPTKCPNPGTVDSADPGIRRDPVLVRTFPGRERDHRGSWRWCQPAPDGALE